MPENLPELGTVQELFLASQSGRRQRHSPALVLGAQASTSLGTTRINHRTTTSGTHTLTKTMGSLALHHTGLKCTFHFT